MPRSTSAKGRDPSGVYDTEVQAAPTPTHRPSAAVRDANNDRREGPSFKDQVRSVTNGEHVNGSSNGGTETSAVAVATTARSKSHASKSSTGPSFKDQVRSVADGVIAEPLKEDEEATGKEGPLDNIGPAFKDQVRHDPQQQQKVMVRSPPPPSNNNNSQNNDAPSVVFADAQLMDPPNNNIIDDNVLPAHVLPGMHAQPQQPPLQPNAEAEGGKSKKTVVIAVVSIVLLAVATIVGGVCGSGACGGGGDESISSPGVEVVPNNSSVTVSTSTVAPTVAPTPGLDARGLAIVDFVNRIKLSDGTIPSTPASLNSGTPEHLAVQFLIDSTDHSTGSPAEEFLLTQKYALLVLWYSTNGPSWTQKSLWLIDEDVCNWFHVGCGQQDILGNGIGLQRVVSIFDLRENNLDGTIPDDFALLQTPSRLLLHDNPNLVGSLPPSLTEFSDLEVFAVHNCGLSGPLPDGIGNWSNLREFGINRNTFTGSLPESIGAWTSLEQFICWENALSGPLPSTIGAWTNLDDFQIHVNDFSGDLPDAVGSWNLLTFLVNNNRFTGTLPSSIGNWSSLVQFDASYNEFTGTLPGSIGNWRNLDDFRIKDNQFIGNLPESVSDWSSLSSVLLNMNQFSGSLPNNISNWSPVEFLISNNTFTGALPEAIGSWTDLTTFVA